MSVTYTVVIILINLIELYQGTTHLILREKCQNITLQCEGNAWQFDLDEDNKVDCHVLSSNSTIVPSVDKLYPGKCDNNISINVKENNNEKPLLQMTLTENRGGFFACVSSLSSNLFPFNASTNILDVFIVAQFDLTLTTYASDIQTKTSVTTQNGESFNLTCTFTIAEDTYEHSVYWVKTFGINCACLWSYNLNKFDSGERHNPYCLIDDSFTKRVFNISSNATTKQKHHNLVIINATSSDSGPYACIFQQRKGYNVRWKVINNVTVTVGGKEALDPTDKKVNPDKEDITPFYSRVGTLFFGLLGLFLMFVALIVIIMRKRTMTKKESHTQTLKRDQNSGKTFEADSSPYAVGTIEDVFYSVLKPLDVQPGLIPEPFKT